MEFLKTLVHALGTYTSPLLFDRVVLIEMFEIGVNNLGTDGGIVSIHVHFAYCSCAHGHVVHKHNKEQ